MIYFRCKEGHITQCKTPKHRVLYCKQCEQIIPKLECEKYVDKPLVFKTHTKSPRIEYNGKQLYKYTESSRRVYRSKGLTGLYHTVESLKKLSKSLKGRASTRGMTGKRHSIEVRHKISNSVKRYWATEEAHQRLSNSMKNWWVSEYTRVDASDTKFVE